MIVRELQEALDRLSGKAPRSAAAVAMIASKVGWTMSVWHRIDFDQPTVTAPISGDAISIDWECDGRKLNAFISYVGVEDDDDGSILWSFESGNGVTNYIRQTIKGGWWRTTSNIDSLFFWLSGKRPLSTIELGDDADVITVDYNGERGEMRTINLDG